MSRFHWMVRMCRTALEGCRYKRAVQFLTHMALYCLVGLVKAVTDFGEKTLRAARKFPRVWFKAFYQPESLRWSIIVAASFVGALLIAPDFFPYSNPTIGEPAPKTVVSPVTFKVMDEAATRSYRHEVLKSVRPVYDFDDETIHRVLSGISAAFSFMRDYLAAEAAYLARQRNESHSTALVQSLGFLGSGSFHKIDDDTLRARFQSLLGARVTPSGFALLKSRGFGTNIQADLRSLVVPVLLRGVVERRDQVMREGKQGILLRSKSKDKLELVKDVSAILDVKHAISLINSWKNDPVRDTALSRTIRLMAMDLVTVNVTYNPQKSLSYRQRALVSVKPVYFQVARGESIVNEGVPVNEGHAQMLAGLNKANPPYGTYMMLAGLTLVLAIMFRLCVWFSEKHLDRKRNATEDVVLLCFLFVATTLSVRVIASCAPMLPAASSSFGRTPLLYGAPVAASVMLATLRTDARIGLVFAALVSVTSALSVEGDVFLFLFYFVSGLVGLHCMTRVFDRRSLFRAGVFVGLANVICLLAIKLAAGKLPWLHDLLEFASGFLGGILSGLAVSAITYLLGVLGCPTTLRLVMTDDFNHPLLRHMSLDAPGTYRHSVMVATLAEAAAEPICANRLLVRVGSLYHDIGKTGPRTNPRYFCENHERGLNAATRPEQSATTAALISHVAYGVERAKEFRLAQPIIDIIQQHHGTDTVLLFQRSPQDKRDIPGPPCYEGPRPRTKESALVMLADTVEEIWSTLPNPTPASIRKHVKAAVLERFTNGQLDESTLTLKDLDAIIRSFTRTLQGIRKSRAACAGGADAEPELYDSSWQRQTMPHGDQPVIAADLPATP